MTDQSVEHDAKAPESPAASTATPAAGGSTATAAGGSTRAEPEATAGVSETGTEPSTPATTSSRVEGGTSNGEDAGGDAAENRDAGARVGDDRDSGDDAGDDQKVSAEEKKASADEFAKEHDPAKHDIGAGEEARQRGDWTADEPDGRVWDDEGNLVEVISSTDPAGSDGSDGSAGGDTKPDDHLAKSDPVAGGRRTSSLDEVRDGGYSVGSAAVIEGGAMPLGHPVKAWEDTKTFVMPDDHGYGDAEPGLWFTDPGAARRAGFTHAE